MNHETATGRRAALASFAGTAIEWYDFYLYGTASALVFGKLFFPELNPATGVLAAFGTFWVGFLARPLGGIVFGHLGDRVGRKNTLVVTLLLMGFATFAVGLLPTYAKIGIAAPLLLVALRAVQGVAVGGEWGGAVVLAAENAPAGRGSYFAMFAQQGSPAGSILSTVVFLAVSALPDEQFLTWGWRVPFLLSGVLVALGLLIRLKVEEPAEFVRAKAKAAVAKVPLVEVPADCVADRAARHRREHHGHRRRVLQQHVRPRLVHERTGHRPPDHAVRAARRVRGPVLLAAGRGAAGRTRR
ncbi:MULTISPECIES: MFS transporter [unclassified Amycolatopsis]|uniref:MFS transporter n=1 Tax=unclassified Amycolatopsis TaxID=2618356 RepID=UPI001F114C5A|nr:MULTISPECIES: MFS transporter [unclassified Amycolatopsis]